MYRKRGETPVTKGMRRVVSRFNRTGGWSDTVFTMDTKKLSLMQMLDEKVKGFGRVDLKD